MQRVTFFSGYGARQHTRITCGKAGLHRLSAAFVGIATLGLLSLSSAAQAQGWKPDPPELYKSFPTMPTVRGFFLPSADLSHLFPTPGSQGQQSSCTAWAIGYAMRSYYEGRRERWDVKDAEHQLSPAWLYGRLSPAGAQCNVGTAMSEALNLLKAGGATTAAKVPYSAGVCATNASLAAHEVDPRWRIDSWETVDAKDLDSIKTAIHNGNPVAVGMMVPDSFQDLKAGQIYDEVIPAQGGHAMVLVGYDESSRAFKIMNSWGARWADGGFGWVSYRSYLALGSQAYIMRVSLARQRQKQTPRPPAIQPVVITQDDTPNVPIPANITPAPHVPPAPAPLPMVEPQPAPTPEPPAPELIAEYVPPPAPPEPEPFLPPVVDPRPDPEPIVVERLPSYAPDTARKRLKDEAAHLECGQVEAFPATGPIKGLKGFVGSTTDVERLVHALGKEGPSLVGNVDVRKWPQCEALLTLNDSIANAQGLHVAVDGAQPTVLKDQDYMVVKVKSPAFSSYLYVVYIQVNGDAVALSQPADMVSRTTAPNTELEFGRAPGPRYRVGGPFGDEMIVAIASASPLFPGPIPKVQTERQFLTAFRQALLERPQPGAKPRVVAAMTTTLRTQPQ